MTSSPSSQTPTRFASVDALRGITVAAMLLVNNPGTWSHVYAPLEHAQWHGCTPTDLVFPFFLVIVGVSIALGVVPRVEQGADRAALTRTVLVRAARIVGLGLLLHLLAWWWLDLAHYRPLGVLQRIGVCFAAVGVLAIWSRAATQWTCLLLLLFGYAALLAAGGTLDHEPEGVGLTGLVVEPSAVGALGVQGREEAEQRVGDALVCAWRPADRLLEQAHLRRAVQVLLGELHAGAHVEKITHARAGIAGRRECRHIVGDLARGIQGPRTHERSSRHGRQRLAHRHQQVHRGLGHGVGV